MKRSLITGATGFVGANLARRLLREGHEVHLIVRPAHALWRIGEIKADVTLHEADLLDEEALDGVIKSARPEWIFHLAAHGAYPSQTDVGRMVEINIKGTINLVHSAARAGFEAFVNTGTSSEYGFKSFAPSEDAALEPNSYYAVTKASATHFCRYFARKRNLHLPTLRLYSVYGPFEEPSRLVPAHILHGLEGRWPALAAPSAAHDFVYVEDVCDAYLLAAAQSSGEPGAVYNVGTGRQTTLGEVVEVAQRIMSVEVEPVWNSMPGREWDTGCWIANSEKIQRELGWRARHSFEEGFGLTLEWLGRNPRVLELYRELRGASGSTGV